MPKNNKVSVRLTDKESDWVEELKELITEERKGLAVSNSDVLRMALSTFYELEKRNKQNVDSLCQKEF